MSTEPCSCEFRDKDPETHDRLVTIETMGPLEAAMLVADLISHQDMMTGFGPLLPDPDDFGRFVAQHNWTDPKILFELGCAVDCATNQAFHGRHSQQREDADVDRLARRVATLEAWRREMAEEVITKRLLVDQVEVGYSIEVGHAPNARISICSQADEGHAGIMGYAKGDEVGFNLDAADPEHECHGPASAQEAYGFLHIYDAHDDNRVARISIGDDIRYGPDVFLGGRQP